MRECGLVTAPRLLALPSSLIACWKVIEPLSGGAGQKLIGWLDCHRALDSVEAEPLPEARLRIPCSQPSGIVVLAAICKLLVYLNAIEVCLVVTVNLSLMDSRYVVN